VAGVAVLDNLTTVAGQSVEYGDRMPVTLSHLVADSRLGLRVLAGQQALHQPVSWVHVSELDDPTPFLDRGELLLTTGLAIRRGSDLPAFVDRLVKGGIAGLGFGVGLSHDTVPSDLVAAAGASGLPLLEVPRRTPFIAISKNVSAALAAEAYAEVSAVNAAQQALTRAALGRDGVAMVVRRLSQLYGGWTLLLDPVGVVRQAAPASAAGRIEQLTGEIDRLRARGRLASASFSTGADHVVLQALGHPTRGFLAVGRPSPPDRVAGQVLNLAASVLTLTLARSTTLDLTQRRLRAGLLELLLGGPASPERQPSALGAAVAAQLWGRPLPAAPVTVYVLAGPPEALDSALDLIDGDAPGHPGAVFFAARDPYVIVLAEGQQPWVERLPTRLPGLHVGISEPVPYDRLNDGLRQATDAVDYATRTDAALTHFADLAGTGLLGLVPAEPAQAFAESLLAPLLRHDEVHRGDLVRTLAEWLRHHGEWDPTAARLSVHRHTVRNRMRKVAELTSADLDDPGTRAELWFALHLLRHRPLG
jgi:PucR family transcriptional regulator, purine catabolism regulatory protein